MSSLFAGIKGILFDFNGTLLLDSPLHEKAWIIISARLRDTPFTVEEFRLTGHGRTNKAIITGLLGREPDDEELNAIVEEKESYYRHMCLENSEIFRLAPGVTPFLDLLKDAGFPMTIATGSYAVNVDFYFQHLQLARWFDRTKVVFDDGSYPGKPAPDAFILAANKLGLVPAECMVFEDSYMGIQAAYQAGAAHIIAVEPYLDRSKLAVPPQNIVFCQGFPDFLIDSFTARLNSTLSSCHTDDKSLR